MNAFSVSFKWNTTVYTQGNKDGLPIGPEKCPADPFMRMIQLS